MKNKIKILILAEYFYPGYKFGGPQQSIYNFCNYFNQKYEIFVYTRSYDYQSNKNYSSVTTDEWISHNNFKIYYSSKNNSQYKSIKYIIDKIEPDFIYLNSLYADFTRIIFLINFTRKLKQKIVIAPRGELHEGAIKLKWFKKKIYISFLKYSFNLKNIIWQSTDRQESEDIIKHLDVFKVSTAQNIPRLDSQSFKMLKKNDTQKIKFIFLSRIDRKKNLKFAIKLFQNIDTNNYSFDIYGNIHDHDYFNECINMIKSNSNINYIGSAPNKDILNILSKYHYFILPTKGENFGHAIYESFLAGVPVLISDKTPWLNLKNKYVGWDIDLKNEKQWLKVLNSCITQTQDNYNKMRENSNKFALDFLAENNYVIEYSNIFKKDYA